MSVFRSVLNCAKNIAGRSLHGQQRMLQSTLSLRCTGRSLSQQVAAASPLFSSRSLTSTLLKSSTSLSQKRFVQTKSDTEMSDFLRDEIQAEKESLKQSGKAVQVKGFEVETNDAEVVFKKKFENEDIKVTVNVNHAVDAEEHSDEIHPSSTGAEQAMTKMVCRPSFQVEVIKNGVTLGFNCAMSHEEAEEEDDEPHGQGDEFNIEEFSIYKGEFKESVYVMSGEVMDGSFYDNLMNMLDERGINSEFIQEITDFCTLYEQKLYVNLLEHLQTIVKAK